MDISLPLRENELLIYSENINSKNNVLSNEHKTKSLTKFSETANDSLSALHQQHVNY